MTAPAPGPPSPARRAAAAAVGLFAAWQLVYLPAANLIDFVPRRLGPPMEPITDLYQARGAFTAVEPVQRAAEAAGAALDFWSEASGQEQGWSLFAPGMPPYSVFPAVELHFADGTRETLLSQYEPADKTNPPLRPPLIDNRPFNCEVQLIYPVWFAPPEEIARPYVAPEEAATGDGGGPSKLARDLESSYRRLPDSVRKWRGFIRAWLAYRLAEYRAAHPDRAAPVALVLKHRFFPTPKPGEPGGRTAPAVERPYARWRPADDAMEAFDVVGGQFRPVEVTP